MPKRGFDTDIYLKKEKAAILEKINNFKRLYLEVGGKLSYDAHASRVLPGYKKDTKLRLLKNLGDIELIYCLNAKNIQDNRIIHDFNLPYLEHAIREIKHLKKLGIAVNWIVITRFENEPLAIKSKQIFDRLGIPVVFQREIKGYPKKIKKVLEGIDNQPYVPVKEKIIIITAPASGSGKMGVALVQLYHEWKKGIKSAFAKIETFPIWNLPINHEINIAYEAATADLKDEIFLDYLHYKAYKKNAVTYNRDMENFKILMNLHNKINQKPILSYKSPTDMGVGMTKSGIINEGLCKEASKKEILRRYNEYFRDWKNGKEKISTIKRMKQILKKLTIPIPLSSSV